MFAPPLPQVGVVRTYSIKYSVVYVLCKSRPMVTPSSPSPRQLHPGTNDMGAAAGVVPGQRPSVPEHWEYFSTYSSTWYLCTLSDVHFISAWALERGEERDPVCTLHGSTHLIGCTQVGTTNIATFLGDGQSSPHLSIHSNL